MFNMKKIENLTAEEKEKYQEQQANKARKVKKGLRYLLASAIGAALGVGGTLFVLNRNGEDAGEDVEETTDDNSEE